MPAHLSDFQKEMYEHLIDWKHRHLTDKPGYYAGHAYDAVLPDEFKGQLPHLYKPIRQRFLDHQKKFHFKTHKFAGHMASSQVACANLFLPIMIQPTTASIILKTVKPDLASIATDQLDSGFRIEFWDEVRNGIPNQKGLLGDHNRSTGTDADFAIAYWNHQDELNLWLIEHKLTEKEFTTCGGAKTAQLLVWYGRAFYEIVFEYEEGEKPVGFRITHIQDNCIHDAAAFCWQFLPAARSGSFDFSDATEKAVPNLFHRFVWISKSRMLTIKMPSELGGPCLMLRTIRTLAQASRSALPELAIADANESLPKSGYDFTIHQRLIEMRVARATRSFGWPMRGTADETSLEFYRLYRNLLFENTKVIIRNHILDALNNALARMGKVMGFKAEISLLGVRTRKECEDALRDIQSGKLQIGDAWKMLMD